MQKTRKLILDHKTDFEEFEYYCSILDKIDENINDMPDVSIESCKSLIEGMSKTILSKLGIDYRESGRNCDTPHALLRKVFDGIPDKVDYDPEFASSICNFILRITEIRNKRGDISHGKKSPKEKQSDRSLANYISQITDSTAYYLLNIYFNLDLSYLEEVDYDKNEDFNNMLDEEYDLGYVIYSKALYDQDPISYGEQLEEYRSSEEDI